MKIYIHSVLSSILLQTHDWQQTLHWAGARCIGKFGYIARLLVVMTTLVSYSPLGHSQLPYLPDELQVHGFLTQGFFHSSDNNVYGQSNDGISPGLTEIGLNINYQPWDKLRFAAQGLYRRAGEVDTGSLRLDFGLVDLTLLEYDSGKFGLRAGRVKIPYGLYNETRDVAFTHPTIMLPQGIYFDRSRSLFLSADGGAFYAEQRTGIGDFTFKFNVGLPSNELNEIKTMVLATDKAFGTFSTKPAIATQLSYDINGGEYKFAVSYLDLSFEYNGTPNDAPFFPGTPPPKASSITHIQPLLFSAQYNGENLTLTGEYAYTWNTLGNFAPQGGIFATESWYIEASYRILPNFQATVRYDSLVSNIDDPKGKQAAFLGFPAHTAFAQDWVFGLRYDINSSWMVRADYTRVHGAAWLSQSDNKPLEEKQDWDLYGLQFSFKF